MNTSTIARALVVVALSVAACASSAGNSQGQGSSSSGGASQTYTIRMHRPARVGMRVRQTHVAEGRELRVVRANGAVAERSEQRTHVEFNGVGEVLAVNSTSKPSRVRYTVERFEATNGERVTATLAAGALVEVTFGEDAEHSTVTVGSEPASEPIKKALNDAINLSVSDENEDSVFGTQTPRAVGASWPANIEPLRRHMAEGPLEIPAEGMQATVTLVGIVQRESGGPFLDVRGAVDIPNARLRQMPSGFTSMTLAMQMHMRSLLSTTDLDALPVESESSMDSNARGSGTVNGMAIELEMQSHNERRATYAVVP